MDDQMRATAVAAARQLLQRYKEEHPWWIGDRTPIDDLVSWFGLHVATFHPHDYPQGTYGFLESNEDLIWLCRDLAETLRRFTLAHELGHAILHANDEHSIPATAYPQQHIPGIPYADPCQQPDVQEEVTGKIDQEYMQEILGIGQSYDPRSQRELAANIFAAELLMPLQRVRTLYLTQQIRVRDQTGPYTLANIFGVSHAAMLNRLAGLLTEPEEPQKMPGRPRGSPLPYTHDTPGTSILRKNDKEAKPQYSRGDPRGRPGDAHPANPRPGDAHPANLRPDDGHPANLRPGDGHPANLRPGDAHPANARPGDGHPVTSSPVSALPTPEKKQYDEFQQAAIKASTPALIVAGPGSGKTSTLIGRTEYLIDILGMPPQHILALTFSRKAAQEMKERLQQALNNNSDLPTVSTFHAFCAELLRTYAGRVGLRPDFTLIDDVEGYLLLRQLAKVMRLQHYRNLKSPAYYFPDILKAISRAKDELVSPAQYLLLAESMLAQAKNDEEIEKAERAIEVANIYGLYQEDLARRQDTDFGGLILLAVQLLEQFPEIRYEQQQQYAHILVDEFQDINRASGVLLRLLAGDERSVWVVGDANQAIYGFRGSSPANIARFQDDYPGAVVLALSRNYRSRPDIVHLAESFRYKQLESGTETKSQGMALPIPQTGCARGATTMDETRSLAQPDTYVTLAVATDAASELNGLIADIRDKHGQGYKYQDMAILCRTRSLVRKMRSALALVGLPVLESGGMLEQEHIKNLLSIVMLLADPGGMGVLRAARQPEHALSQSDIEALLLSAQEQKRPPGTMIVRDEAPPGMSAQGRRSLSRLSDILQSLYQHATSIWSLLAQYLFVETSLVRDLLGDVESKHSRDFNSLHSGRYSSMLADYTAILQLARRYDQQQVQGRSQPHPYIANTLDGGVPLEQPPPIREQARGFLDYLSILLTLRQEGGSRHQGAEGDGEDSADMLRVMTVHASKGLEFPVVYLPNLLQQRFPLQAHGNPVPAPAGMLPAGSEGKVAHESGEACLFYVGVTRARDHLVLSYSEHYGKRKARPSPYLDALLAGLPNERTIHRRWQDPEVPTIGKTTSASMVGVPARGTLATTPATVDTLENLSLSSQPSNSFIEAMQAKTLHASALDTYQRCPRQYAYSNIYHFRSEEATYQLFWRATRNAFADLKQSFALANSQVAGQEAHFPTQQEAQQLYMQHWQALEGPAYPFAAVYEQHGSEVIELLRCKLLESGDTDWELRQNFTVEVAGRTLHFSVDRVEASPQGNKPVKFVRTHFGKRGEKPTAGLRELLYARAYCKQHPGQNIELHYHNLSTGETQPITLTPKKEQSLYDELEQSILGMERNEYPPMPDPFLCPICPFFLICPA